MRKKYLNYFYLIIGTIYLTIGILSFLLKIDFLLFLLSSPWSSIVAFFGFLLIHMFSNFPFDLINLFGVFLNFIIFLKITIFKTDSPNETIDLISGN